MIHHLSSDHLQNDIKSGNFDFLFFWQNLPKKGISGRKGILHAKTIINLFLC